MCSLILTTFLKSSIEKKQVFFRSVEGENQRISPFPYQVEKEVLGDF